MKTLMREFSYAKETGRVLDVGSGNNPVNIATHLVDLYPEGADERGGILELPPTIQEFKVGSLEAIPYPDRYFDLIHASHVIEHVDHPDLALKEIARAGRAAYIETPAAVMEYGLFREPPSDYPGWRFHRWFVWSESETAKLYFKPKTDRNLKQYCDCKWGKRFGDLVAKRNLGDIDPYLPYDCKMNQTVWTGDRSIAFDVWSEDQTGKLDARGVCNCAFAAFFKRTKRYFRNPRHIYRLFRFWRREPEVFSLFREMHRALK